MKEYLRIKSGSFHLMLDAIQILEIIEINNESDTVSVGDSSKIETASEHISWREHMLKLIDWQQILGQKPSQTINFHVVYQLSNPSQAIVYAIDQIIGLVHLEKSDFLTLPPLPEKLSQLFDKAYFDNQQQIQVMCLRSELSLDTIEAYLVDSDHKIIPIQESQNVED